MIRVLIVDDSLLARNAIQRALEQDPEIRVVGMASNGEEALEKIADLNPSVMTCDMEMPVMDGVQTLMQVRKQYPGVKVIVLSSITQPNSTKEQICRNLGAFAVMAKPVRQSNLNAVTDGDELLQHIRRSAGLA
jgi:two-component system chemotaxis response regulator CheB